MDSDYDDDDDKKLAKNKNKEAKKVNKRPKWCNFVCVCVANI